MTVADPVAEEVRPGLWSLPVAIPVTGLKRVFVYAFAVPDGVVIVDAGWSSQDSLDSLQAGLRAMGAELGDVRGALFTHFHPDHYGLAAPLREAGAWIALHPDDAKIVDAQLHPQQGRRAALGSWLEEAGAPAEAGFGDAFRPGFPTVAPDRLLADGERLGDVLPGWSFEVVHTPGHSPGHVCFVDRAAEIVLCGDHVLSRTTPNVSLLPGSPADPLGDYIAALRKMVALGDLLGLGGHEAPMPSIAARAQEIIDHHTEQLEFTQNEIAAGARTVLDVAERMPWSRPWTKLHAVDRLLALGEAQAHLVRLERSGSLRLAGRGPLRWEIA
jgi:glyoxylase-like metal-dependent hydrolase (beta-lactamase superfamily II)